MEWFSLKCWAILPNTLWLDLTCTRMYSYAICHWCVHFLVYTVAKKTLKGCFILFENSLHLSWICIILWSMLWKGSLPWLFGTTFETWLRFLLRKKRTPWCLHLCAVCTPVVMINHSFFSTTRTLGIVGLFIHSVWCITLLCRQLQPTPQSKSIFFHTYSIYACFLWNIYSSRYILDYQINMKYKAYMAYFSFDGF